jgi:hypothetical protein
MPHRSPATATPSAQPGQHLRHPYTGPHRGGWGFRQGHRYWCSSNGPSGLRISMVGDTGFEPVTSSVSRKRAPTAPIARGGCGNRTRVQGFAGPCLCHSANPPVPLRGRPGGRAAAASGRRGSNPRPSPWQGDALPTALRPRASGLPATEENFSPVCHPAPNDARRVGHVRLRRGRPCGAAARHPSTRRRRRRQPGAAVQVRVLPGDPVCFGPS